jgi:RNA recognition motif-containing protein
MNHKLYVGNLSYSTSDADLLEYFSRHGDVRTATVMTDRETGRSKGFGFVEMGSESDAQAAISALHGQSIDGRQLTVNVARPREERTGSFGGGARRGFGGYGGGRASH